MMIAMRVRRSLGRLGAITAVCALALFGQSSTAFAQSTLRGGSINALTFDSGDQAFVESLRNNGMNFVRLYYFNDDAASQSEAEYRSWFENSVLPNADQLVPLFANTYGMTVLLSIHTAPGGRSSSRIPVDTIFIPGAEHDWKRSLLVEMFTAFAERFNSYGSKVAYQLFSEPAPLASNKAVWEELQGDLISAIRSAGTTPVDEQPTIFYMTLYGNPKLSGAINLAARQGSMGLLMNFYTPWNYTHQQTPSAKNASRVLHWPNCQKLNKSGRKQGKKNKNCRRKGLQRSLSKYVKFTQKNDLRRVVAETSVSRFASGAPRYLNDALRTLERLDIGYAYFTLTERGDSPWRLDCVDPQVSPCVSGESATLSVFRNRLAQ